MLDLLAPFGTYHLDHPDFNPQDDRAETQRLIQREDAIEQFLRGEVEEDYLLDMLQEHTGIGADAYIDVVTSNVDHIINNNIPVDVSEGGILLPRFS